MVARARSNVLPRLPMERSREQELLADISQAAVGLTILIALEGHLA